VLLLRPRKNNCGFPVTRPTLILTPDPTKFFSFFLQKECKYGGKKKNKKQKNYNLLPKYHDGNGYFPWYTPAFG
jgi:hypothetical protein